jgi:transcriptional regulator with XRE-family HTH domain
MQLTQAELARELGVSRAAVSRWESGKREIDSILALALDCLAERRAGKKRRTYAKGRK